mgnify:CR=1 FL=1
MPVNACILCHRCRSAKVLTLLRKKAFFVHRHFDTLTSVSRIICMRNLLLCVGHAGKVRSPCEGTRGCRERSCCFGYGRGLVHSSNRLRGGVTTTLCLDSRRILIEFTSQNRGALCRQASPGMPPRSVRPQIQPVQRAAADKEVFSPQIQIKPMDC